jgi:hypothetical protein
MVAVRFTITAVWLLMVALRALIVLFAFAMATV